MAKLTLTDITSGYGTATKINANNTLIENALENTLSRDGTGPNEMNADLDMNSYRILNLQDAVSESEPVTLRQAAEILAIGESTLTQEEVGAVLYPRSGVEVTAGVTPSDYRYPELDARRYGVAVASTAGTNATGINNAILVAYTAGGGIVELPYGALSYNSSIILRDGVILRGRGQSATVLSYTGSAEGMKSVSPGTRIYNCGVEGVYLTDAGTGTYGIDLDSVSTSIFRDLTVNGFTTAIRNYSPTSGYSVYNRFYNVTANGCTTGFVCSGTSSNAHVFDACRFNGLTVVGTVGWLIADSNGNTVINCHTDVCGIHAQLTATTPGVTDGNVLWANRIEGCTTGHDVGAGVRHTHIGANYYSTVTNRITNAGTDTLIYDPAYNTPGIRAEFYSASAAGGHISYTRNPDGGSSLPFMVLTDANTGAGTPRTLEINTERTTGTFIAGRYGGATKFEAFANGNLDLEGRAKATGFVATAAAPTVSSGQIGFGGTFQTTVGAAGGGSALPGNPVGYILVNIAGTTRAIPFWPAS